MYLVYFGLWVINGILLGSTRPEIWQTIAIHINLLILMAVHKYGI